MNIKTIALTLFALTASVVPAKAEREYSYEMCLATNRIAIHAEEMADSIESLITNMDNLRMFLDRNPQTDEILEIGVLLAQEHRKYANLWTQQVEEVYCR